MAAMVLPSPKDAAEDPARAAEAIQALVRESLSEDFRNQYASDDTCLGAISDLLLMHLDSMGSAAGSDHEDACISCIKLARNLSANCSHAQEFWWRRGLPARIAARLREDVALPDQRSLAWRSAVPGFLTNSITGHARLREGAVSAWFPYEISAVCSLCWDRPELAFMFCQNLMGADSDEMPMFVRQLFETPNGHCIIFLLISMCCNVDDSESKAPLWEWATLFFNKLWMYGGFESVYRGVKQLSATKIHDFLCASVLTESGDHDGHEPGPPLGIAVVVKRLCGHAEALGFLWHSIHGLLDGGDGDSGRQQALKLAQKLLCDDAFVKLAAEEMASTLARLTFEWQLDWIPEVPSQEASVLLGLAEPHDVDPLTLASLSAAAGGRLQSGGRGATATLFGELCGAASALVLSSHSFGIQLPPRLIGTYLTANIACLDALHRFRFGDFSNGTAQQHSLLEAAEVSQACHHLDQLRLCGSVLYENRLAQDFLRLTGGLRILLSNCYADEHLPLLRENGIFAIRNATLGNPANQELARRHLEERKTDASMPQYAQAPMWESAEELGLG